MSQTLRVLPKPSPILVARLRRNGFCNEICLLETAHGTNNSTELATSLLVVRANLSTFQAVTQVATLKSFGRYMRLLESICDPMEAGLKKAEQFIDELIKGKKYIFTLKEGVMFFAHAFATVVVTALAFVPTIVAGVFSFTVGALLNLKEAKVEVDELRHMALIEVGNYTD